MALFEKRMFAPGVVCAPSDPRTSAEMNPTNMSCQ